MDPTKPARRRMTKRKVLCGLALLFLGFLVALFSGWLQPRHPQFGAIYEANAYDLDYARFNRFGQFLRKHLPNAVIQSPYFPERFKDTSRALQLGDTQLEWSIGGATTGWLYFWEVAASRGRQAGGWEFAPCAETNFLKVHQLPARFYPRNDPQCAEVFGPKSTTNAIPVTQGDLLFARRNDRPTLTYLLYLSKQEQTKLTVRYCIIDRK